MEKDAARHYRAYDSLKAANNGNTSSLKRTADHNKPLGSEEGCSCLPDRTNRRSSLLKGIFRTLSSCLLCVLYALLGGVIFLTIEGGNTDAVQRTLATTIPHGNEPVRGNRSAWLKQVIWINLYWVEKFPIFFTKNLFILQINREARARTVENIWVLTEKLNILYKDNWTALAAQEIARFQDQLMKRITEDVIASQSHATTHYDDTVTERRVIDYEWNFAKAFLYSLTVLTTIGE